MGMIPIPGKMYLNDFPDKITYTIVRNGEIISKSDGLTNDDENGNHIAFLYGTDIQTGDTISSDFSGKYQVKSTGIDTYRGNPEIIKAYY